MAFDVLDKLRKAKDSLTDLGVEKTQEVLGELNLVLSLLKGAGYDVSEVETELAVPPKVTIHLKTTSAVSEDKLNAILRDNQDKGVVTAIVTALIQANRLRGSIRAESLELSDIKVVLAASPTLVLQWKDKGVHA